MLTQSSVRKTIGQVQEQDEGCQQRHHSDIAEFQPWRPLTIGCDGRLHYPLHALLRQRAFLADLSDVQQTSIDLSPDLLQVGQIGDVLADFRSVGLLMVVSVRRARPSLKYCLM